MFFKNCTYIFFMTLLAMLSAVAAMNYIVDPYSMTKYNMLGIPVKLVSDDRSEKISRINGDFNFDNIMLGSSRVYLINPHVVSKYAKGSTYNLGVGAAQIEDHLGFLLYLEKLNKFPKLVIIGLDFYSFNKNLETNKYFVRNKELNFLSSNVSERGYWSEFISLDMLMATIKTLKTFIGMNDRKSKFDVYGAARNGSSIFEYFPESEELIDIYTRALERRDSAFIKNLQYTSVSDDRIGYLKRVVNLCDKHNTDLKVFITPLYSQLLDDVYNDSDLVNSLNVFKKRVSEITGYYDFLTYNEVTKSSFYFGDPSHVKHETGNLMLARLFNDDKVTIPDGFGVYRNKEGLKNNRLEAN